MKKLVFLFLTLGVIFAWGVGGATAATIDVGPSYTYTNITSGIAAASANDTIVVHANPSNYTEQVVVNKAGLTITPFTGDNVTVQTTGSGTVFTISGVNFVTISGFNIQGNDSSVGTGVALTNANNCNIINNFILNRWKGVSVTGSNNIISGNSIYNTVMGVTYTYPSNNNTATTNTISNPSYNPDSQVRLGMREDGSYFGTWTPNQNNKYLNNVISNVNEGIFIQQGSNFTISGNTITIKDTVNYPWAITLSVGNTANQIMTLNNNMITAEGNSGFGSRGIYLISNPSSPSNAAFNFYGNSISNFGEGFYSNLYTPTGSSTAQIYLNRIYNNTHGVNLISSNTIFNLTNNWWGKNDGLTVYTSSPPGVYDIYYNAGTVTYNPWLVLNATSSPNTIQITNNSTITADLTRNSNGIDTTTLYGGKTVINDLKADFVSDALGSVNPVTSNTLNGNATTTFTANFTVGISTVSVTLDGVTVNTMVNITGGPVYNNRTLELFSTIQAAIDSVNTLNGDTLIATGATYVENVMVNKELTIQSMGTVTVTAFDALQPTFILVTGSNNSNITGFIITGGSTGIYVNNVNNSTLNINNITGNSWAGVAVYNSQGTRVESNTISGNQEGIYIMTGSANNTITNNIITGNTNSGVAVDTSSNTTISGNTLISGNSNGVRLFQSTGNTVTGNIIDTNSWSGIVIDGSTHNTITLNTLTGNLEGIHIMSNSNLNNISQNNITGNLGSWCGISIWNCTNNTLGQNMVTGKQEGIYLTQGANYNTITGNNIHNNTNSAICLDNNSMFNNITMNIQIDSNGNGIRLYQVTNNTISQNNVTNSAWAGICLDNASNNTVSKNTVTGNQEGIYVFNNSNQNTITNNTATSNTNSGICINNAISNTISLNTINLNGNGIRLFNFANQNNIMHNNLTSQGWAGVVIDGSNTNSITLNTITTNTEGLYSMNGSTGNQIYTNNFQSNNRQAYDEGTNTYDNATIGNYWNDYIPPGPYNIPGGSNVDNYPSTTPF